MSGEFLPLTVDIKGVYLDVPGPTSSLPSAPPPLAQRLLLLWSSFFQLLGDTSYLIDLCNSSPLPSDLSSLSIHSS